MMRALIDLALRHLVAHRAAVAIALGAVACGVAAVLAALLLHGSVLASYEATVERLTGRAALHVTNGTSGVAEEVVERLRDVPGVRALAPSVEGFVSVLDDDGAVGERIYLYGVDLLGDAEVREYDAAEPTLVDDPLAFLAATDSVALTADLARARGVVVGDRVRVLTPAGVVSLTVRALLGRQRGPASALDGRLAVVDLSVAQELLRMPGRVSTIAIVTEPTADVAAVARAVAARVDGLGLVETPRARTSTFARLLANYRFGLVVAAAVAMVVAVYFVFTLATIAVTERRRELGLLRLVGMRRRDVGALVTIEMLMLGVVGALAGLPLGLGVARVMLGSVSAGAAALYAAGGGAVLAVEHRAVVASLMLGMGASLLGVVGPVRTVLRASPLDAVRTAPTAARDVPYARGLAGAGLVLMLATIGVWLGRARLGIPVGPAGTLAMLGALVGTALAAPVTIRAAVVCGDRWATASGGIVPLLAGRSLAAEGGGLALTCSALLLSLAGAVGIATWIASLDATLQAAFEDVFANVDLVVSAGADPFAPEATRMPADVAAGIAALPGVAFADPVRVDTIDLDGARATVVATDGTLLRDGRRRLFLIDGDPRDVATALADGSGAVVNRTFAERFGRRRGDVVSLPTPNGPLRVRIAGIHLDLTPGDLGTIRLDRTVYRRWWRDDSASLVEVAVARSGDRRAVSEAIRRRWGASHALVVLTLEQVRAEYAAMLGRLATLVYPLVGVAIGSALVGTVSGRAASMIARRRVHGLLRAAGATRGQLAQVCGLETAGVVALASITALVAGSLLGAMQVEIFLRGMLGMSVAFAYPHATAWAGTTALLLAGGTAGWLLGHRAGRPTLREVLRWE